MRRYTCYQMSLKGIHIFFTECDFKLDYTSMYQTAPALQSSHSLLHPSSHCLAGIPLPLSSLASVSFEIRFPRNRLCKGKSHASGFPGISLWRCTSGVRETELSREQSLIPCDCHWEVPSKDSGLGWSMELSQVLVLLLA